MDVENRDEGAMEVGSGVFKAEASTTDDIPRCEGRWLDIGKSPSRNNILPTRRHGLFRLSAARPRGASALAFRRRGGVGLSSSSAPAIAACAARCTPRSTAPHYAMCGRQHRHTAKVQASRVQHG